MELPDPERQRTAPESYRRTFRNAAIVLLALAIGTLTLTLILVERWESSAGTSSTMDGSSAGGSENSPFTATMYYVAANGLGLVRREIEIPYGTDTLSRARIIVERQLERAPRQLLSPFPRETRLRAVYLANYGTLFVDLSGEVTTEHSGGSLDELLTVYALVNALTTNIAEISGVQILVDGREVDTLAGHIDLRQPLTPNLTWVVDLPRPRTEEESPPPDDQAGTAERIDEPAVSAIDGNGP